MVIEGKQILYLYRADGDQFVKVPDEYEKGVVYLGPEDLEALKTVSVMGITGNNYSDGRTVVFLKGPQYYRHWDFLCGRSQNQISDAVGLINRFASGYLSGVKLLRAGKNGESTSYQAWTNTGGHAHEYVEEAVKGLSQFYYKVKGLPPDCTDQVYTQYRETGVYYKNSELKIRGIKARYQVPVSAAANKEYNVLRTATEKEHTNQKNEVAYQETYLSAIENCKAQQTLLAAEKSKYDEEVTLSRLVRYGLIAACALTGLGAAALATVGIVRYAKRK